MALHGNRSQRGVHLKIQAKYRSAVVTTAGVLAWEEKLGRGRPLATLGVAGGEAVAGDAPREGPEGDVLSPGNF
jgi:hypothetical protein